ncbi:hypothetical protein Dsin_016783 [Dipteronia sinensis]|uniref:CCHC-type domain-containing protein n=1 Tax=Dipteronia sinensis TaxID=43782 RepID=A0AAE0E621_9ROSI|nr:hypothetical protein Dsin_016783 [Dipteronia sinensis]
MNADEIVKLYDALSIKEKERPVQTLDDRLKVLGKQRLALCLVGKILTNKLVNREVFMNVMNKIWKVDGGVEIEPIKGNIFAFYFKNLEGRQRILKGGPWSFDRAIIAFEIPTGTREVQIHNLPLLCLTEDIGTFLGGMIGEVSDVDSNTTTDGSDSFLRVRVKVPVDEPFRRVQRVDLLGDGKVTTMLLRYERLLDYCFRCGRLGHIIDACSDEDNSIDMSSDASRKLEVWLRASSPPKHSFLGLGKYGNKTWDKHKQYESYRSTGG